jgi:HlyD family secretion protein
MQQSDVIHKQDGCQASEMSTEEKKAESSPPTKSDTGTTATDAVKTNKNTGKIKDPLRYQETVSVVTTSISSWVIILSVGSFGLLIWACFAKIPQTVSGSGILSIPYKIVGVPQPQSGGLISEIRIRPNMIIKKGDTVATVNYSSLANAVVIAQQSLKAAQLTYATTFQTVTANNLLKQQMELVKTNQSFLQQAQQVFEKGAISRSTVDQAQQNATNALQTYNSTLSSIQQGLSNVTKAQINLKSALLTQQQQSIVTNQINGKVIDVYPRTGNQTNSSNLFYTVLRANNNTSESGKEDLKVLGFLDPSDAAIVSIGMPVRVLPSNILPNTVGYISGRVTYMSQLPTTTNQASYLFGDSTDATNMTTNNRSMRIEIALDKDATSATGYKWISGSGPRQTDKTLFPKLGLVASFEIINKNVPPITIAIPALKQFFGIY